MQIIHNIDILTITRNINWKFAIAYDSDQFKFHYHSIQFLKQLSAIFAVHLRRFYINLVLSKYKVTSSNNNGVNSDESNKFSSSMIEYIPIPPINDHWTLRERVGVTRYIHNTHHRNNIYGGVLYYVLTFNVI